MMKAVKGNQWISKAKADKAQERRRGSKAPGVGSAKSQNSRQEV
jgi:hypothetical protein